jgi:hypothetical protein
MKSLACSLLLIASLASVHAQGFYTSMMDGAQDGGGARTGSGSFSLFLSATNTLTISGTFSGLSGNSTLAHIHGPSGPFPATAGVIYDFTPSGLNLATLGGTSGGINGTFPLIPKGSGGSYTVAQQIDDLNNGLWYLNVHSTTFGGGEIRGVITQVPEPSTLGLAGLGVAAIMFAVRRHRKA